MNLIDRDALIAKLEITEECIECKWANGAYCNRWNTFVDACEAILKAPVIEQPEIIYCKDCKFAKLTVNDEVKYCDVWSPDDKVYMDAKTNFCSCGERKEEITDG